MVSDLQKKCSVCHSSSDLEAELADVTLYRCSKCDHCFSVLNDSHRMEVYSDSYYQNDHKNWFNNPNLFLFKRLSAVISNSISIKTILEMGCGKGEFLNYLFNSNKSLQLTGVDLTKNEPSNNIRFIQGDAFSVNIDGTFDAVVTLAVIEHISEPNAYTLLLKKLCSENGLIIIMTLNDRSILYQMSRLLRKIGITGPHERLYGKHHLNHFNTSSLNKLLELNHLERVSTIAHDIPFAAIDTGATSAFADVVIRLAVQVMFCIGRICNRTYLQTVICKNHKRLLNSKLQAR